MGVLPRFLATTAVAVAGLAATVPARAEQPAAELRDYYSRNAGRLDDLARTVADASRPAAERVAAFRRLRVLFPQAALEPALKALDDGDAAVAAEAARFLAAQVTMMNHGGAAGGHVHAADDPVSRAIAALHGALDDPREEVRSIAATTLASMGDQVALRRLGNAYDGKRIKDEEAVRYFTLASADVAAPYVEKILATGSVQAKSQAIAYLAPLPQYTSDIRDKYLLDEGSATELRATAARVLAKSDPQFGTYALTLTSDPDIPTAVFKSLMTGVLERGGPTLDAGRIKALTKSIDRFEASRPDADLGNLKVQLRGLNAL